MLGAVLHNLKYNCTGYEELKTQVFELNTKLNPGWPHVIR